MKRKDRGLADTWLSDGDVIDILPEPKPATASHGATWLAATPPFGRPGRAWDYKHLTFLVDPVDVDTANTHLELVPGGIVVIAGPRGPLGGWGTLRYAKAGDRLGRGGWMRDRTCHIVVGYASLGQLVETTGCP